ncbi:MAG TPA: endonuclease III domain-containing protein [Dissulfurispiraceae bacterium]|nr:endonuclease III domain-containing protein [Dissulfurispiraceae bacterium]
MKRIKSLQALYEELFAAFGPQHWWPGETPFEIAVGAILTQNTNWSNVEKAIANIKQAKALDARALHALPDEDLAALVRPAGYFNVKARRLKAFLRYLLSSYSGSLSRMKKCDLGRLRPELLNVHGIGPETADSILLYALGKPVFVIDAYTKRVLSRHGVIAYEEPYDAYQRLFHEQLPPYVQLYNEFHALFVRVGKEYCRPKPRCGACPLSKRLPRARNLLRARIKGGVQTA